MWYKGIDWKKLILSVLVCQFAGVIGSIFNISSIPSWYEGLVKPDIIPPNWSFSVVWTTIFLLMGIALYLVWMQGWEREDVRYAIGIFGVQLFLNILWSALFFGLRSPVLGLIEIVILWCVIALNIWVFYRISKPAGYLLFPYIAWVTVATYLNYSIMVLNPDLPLIGIL